MKDNLSQISKFKSQNNSGKLKSTKRVEAIIDILLKNRRIKTEKEKKEFFNPKCPKKIKIQEVGIIKKELDRAIKRIQKAINDKEKIIVWGDYDVDGICAAAVLWESLDCLGANALPYIPSRFTDGYGLKSQSIKRLKNEHPDVRLIITVDNGIVAHEAVETARLFGIDVIITDHHQPGPNLPRAISVIHTTEISGAGVAWFLSKALKSFGGVRQQDDHLGLAALGTIADVLPLVGFNRAIVKHGLSELHTTSRLGIITLCNEAGVDQSVLDTYHVGFILAPRLNAAGRIQHAMDSLRLICTRNNNRALELAIKLGHTNRLRQDRTEYAISHIEKNFGDVWKEKLPKLLFVYHDSYDEGIVGIAAGRLTEKYYRPAIVGSIKNGMIKASARSVSGVNIVELIRRAGGDLLLSAGGHPMAAGFSLDLRDIDKFEKRLQKVTEELEEEIFIRESNIDTEIEFLDITHSLYKKLLAFKPYGFGNPQPIFLTRDVIVRNFKPVGYENQHLQLSLEKNGRLLHAIGFRMGELFHNILPNQTIDVVYSIEQDDWNMNGGLQLRLREVRL